MRREVERIPDWMALGLVERKDEEKKASSPLVWRRVDVGGVDVIVRTAKKIGKVVKNVRRAT